MTSLQSLEICAGAGGQALGLERAGFAHAAAVEIESIACATLRRNRPDWTVLNQDVRDLTGRNYRGIDLLPPLRAFTLRSHGRVFAAAAGGDSASADCLDQLERGIANGDAGTTFELVRFAGSSAHGVTMGAQGEHPELWTQLDRWIRSHN